MKVRNSIRAYKLKKGVKMVFRKGRRYLLDPKNPKHKVRQG